MCKVLEKNHTNKFTRIGTEVADVFNLINFLFLMGVGLLLMLNKKFHKHPYRIVATACLIEAVVYLQWYIYS